MSPARTHAPPLLLRLVPAAADQVRDVAGAARAAAAPEAAARGRGGGRARDMNQDPRYQHQYIFNLQKV